VGLITNAARGAFAGTVATLAMDLLWFRRYRAEGGDDRFVAWELGGSAQGFDDSPAPAQVGKRIADGVGIDLPDSAAAVTNDVVHWSTGIGWGKFAGLVARIVPVPRVVVGLGTGVAAWGASYAVLGKVGIYRPITEYDRATLWKDLSAHLVHGAALGIALRVAERVRRR
jgi:hypothetical protein